MFGHYKKEFDKFAVCPKCSACHRIPSSASANVTCTVKSEYTSKTCGAELLRKVKCGKKYKRPYWTWRQSMERIRMSKQHPCYGNTPPSLYPSLQILKYGDEDIEQLVQSVLKE
ncbi:hypothetical protein EMCRGX_G029786 [Ephydatia muelleri]